MIERRSTTRLSLAGTVAAVLMLVACGTDGGTDDGGDDPAGPPQTSEASADPVASPDAPSTEAPTAPVPEFPAGTAPQKGRGSGPAGLVLTDVRVGGHDGFDRVVLQFSGAGTPGWGVEYVDSAVLEGSGDVVALDGDATLQVVASGTTAPAPDYYSGPRRVEARTGSLTEVYVGGTFEGYTQVFTGIDGGAVPFRVFTLSEPSRLVVDVRDGSDG